MTMMTNDIRAMVLLAELRSRGFACMALGDDTLSIESPSSLTDADHAAIQALRPELLTLLRDGAADLIEPPEDLREWVNGLDPIRREGIYFIARAYVRMTGGTIHDGMREAKRGMTRAQQNERSEHMIEYTAETRDVRATLEADLARVREQLAQAIERRDALAESDLAAQEAIIRAQLRGTETRAS